MFHKNILLSAILLSKGQESLFKSLKKNQKSKIPITLTRIFTNWPMGFTYLITVIVKKTT